MDDMVDVGCLMLATMDSELQKQHENMVAYEMIQNLKEIYEGQARQESDMKKDGSKSILLVREAKGNGKKVAKSKGSGKTKAKGKNVLKPKGAISKDGKCFHCNKSGHWKRNCPVYLEEVKKAKAVGASVSGTAHEKESS
ncbi:hypothetical protein V6N11_054766 [Hibiscus sabdariffa]|uniref:CCHC-type domain-containing protein n=1 Tax=Hibiscus sabdariffa TaxID=183260 RepID=A0ABR2S4W5_9ROSI